MKFRPSQVALYLVGGTLMLVSIWGCASPPPSPCTSTQCLIGEGKAPEWINEPQGYSDEPGIMYGVGSASGISNKSLLRRAAQEQAKNEVASLLNTSVKSSFSKKTIVSSGVAKDSSEVNDLKDELKSHVEKELVGTKILAVWVNSYVNEAYALASLNKTLACENIVSSLGDKGNMTNDAKIQLRQDCLKQGDNDDSSSKP